MTLANKITSYPIPEGTSGSGDVDVLIEIRSAMDDLRYHNHTLEDEIHIIK